MEAIRDGDYIRFNEYFSEGEEGKVSQDTFHKAGKIITSQASYATYEMVTFLNSGDMLLIMLTPFKIQGKYEIQNIVIVPDEIKD